MSIFQVSEGSLRVIAPVLMLDLESDSEKYFAGL
jgi:hypothetical protein